MSEITYAGYTAVPSDYECDDGQLALSLNLVQEKGSLEPLFPPSVIFTLPDDCIVTYIHKTKDFTHYIIENTETNCVWWLDDNKIEKGEVISDSDLNDNNALISGEDAPKITSIQAVGNTLIIVTEKATNYFLWKEGDYLYLGTGTPQLNVKFALNSIATLKMYPDTGVTKTTSENDDGDKSESSASFTVLKGATFSISNEGGETYLDFPDVMLNRDKKYRFRQLLLASANSLERVRLYATPEGGTESTYLQVWNPSEKYMIVKDLDQNYSNVRLRLNCASDHTASGTIYLEYEDGARTDSDIYYVPYTQENYQCVLGYINKFVAEEVTNENKFIHPFFVRYTVRLYDASYAYISDPILMIPNSGYAPFVHCDNAEYGDKLNLYAFISELQYKLEENISDDWADIIQGIEIYVSQPIYPYDQSEEYEQGKNKFVYKDRGIVSDYTIDQIRGLSFGYGSMQDVSENVVDSNYVVCDLLTAIYQEFGFGVITEDNTVAKLWRLIQVAPKDTDDIKNDICGIANFYLIKKINLSDLQATENFVNVEMEDDTLRALVAREALSEDVVSYAGFAGNSTFVYNGRLHMYGGKAIYKDVVKPTFLNNFLNSDTTEYVSDDRAPLVDTYTISNAWVYIHTSVGDKVVKTVFDDVSVVVGGYMWLYYPNNRAYKMVIELDNGTCMEFPLTEHEYLNGAYFFYYFPYVLFATEEYQCDTPTDETDNTIDLTNSIYVSQANNPFTFYNQTAVTVGSGGIKALSSAAKALSQGQFGNFPLYAFCDDGVWALSVSSEGVYSAVQPITRDFCTNPKAITQLDSSVLFPTDRGIMQISGANATCVTDVLNGDNTLDLTTLPHYDELLHLAGHDEVTLRPIYDLLKTCVILYDYVNQHVFVCDDEHNMAYVISTLSQAWGMATVDIKSTVNSYPEAYAMDSNNNFVNFSYPNSNEKQKCFLITRPLKLDNPNALKTVTAMIQRGFFYRGHVQCALYGSRDLFNWHFIGSSKIHEMRAFNGTPYKYFRIAVLAQLYPNESLFGATVNNTVRFNNKVR